ncbi:hypothetical protein ABBQ38_000582 [Trebouxia sp. C0009 RCD-2024]
MHGDLEVLTVLSLLVDLRNVSHARQRLMVGPGKRPSQPWENETPAKHITGLSVTPGGRLLVAHSDRLRQYSFLRIWTPEEHQYYPARLKAAAKLLLLAAACNPGSASPKDTDAARQSEPV